MKITTILCSFLLVGLTSCLKERTMNTPPGQSPTVVAFGNTGDNVAGSTSTYPGFYTDLGSVSTGASATFNVNVEYDGAGDAPSDITVNLGIDANALNKYNTENGTAYTVPPAGVYSIPASLVIKKGTRAAQGQIKITVTNSFDFSAAYALPVSITSTSNNAPVSANFGKVVYSFGVRNAYDGHYSFKGYTLRAGDGAKTGNFVDSRGMDLVTSGANSLTFGTLQVWADLTGVGIGNPNLSIASDNSVTVSSSGGAKNLGTYSNRYDPTTKTFYISYYWGAGPTSRLATDTLTYIRPR